MKTIRLLFASATLISFIAVNPASAQTQPTLGVQLYAGVNITGTVGAVYEIQATTNLAQSNAWGTVALVQLPVTNYLWLDGTAPATAQRFYRTLSVASVPSNLVFIPAGTFMMGSPTNEKARTTDEIQHSVTITRGFFMDKYLVTQGDFLAVVGGVNPSFYVGNTNRPVEQVSWNDATNYCALRTAQERAAGLISTNLAYRLPTSAEWEYACRAGTTSAFYFGSGMFSGQQNFNGTQGYDSSVGPISNPAGVFLQTTTPVGNYSANGWGLYDMAGNVLEWCQDWYGAYPTGPVTDPQGPVTGPGRVVRGGTWQSFAVDCRSARHYYYVPTFNSWILGFRVVMAPVQ